MWLYKRPMAVADAAVDISRLATGLPRRLRARVMEHGLQYSDGFELEGVALVHALAVLAIESSKFAATDRDRLQDRFTVTYADRILRMRLTENLFEMHRPLEAVEAGNTMRGLRLSSHDRLDLFNLHHLLGSRLSAYRRGRLEDMIDAFLANVEAEPGFELMFSLAVFITDSTQAMRQHVDDLAKAVYLV